MSGDLLIERSDAMLRLTINRPDKRNALSRPLLQALRAALEDHAPDETLKLVVLRGAGDKSFAAGGDLNDLSTVRTIEQTAEMAQQAKAALGAARDFPVPVVAALNGDALGGGAELAMACDFRVLASHARIGFLQGRINVATAWGGGIDLYRLVGRARGLALLCTAELVGGEAAVAMGLANAAAAEGEALDEALERFIAPLRRQAPQVLRAFKRLAIEVSEGASRHELDELETRLFCATWVHPDHWAAADKLLSA